MTEIPQEAIDAAGGELAGYIAGPFLFVHAKDALEAALPFLRSQWEQELQSDEGIERVAASIYDCHDPARWWDCPANMRGHYRDEARLVLRAALGEAT